MNTTETSPHRMFADAPGSHSPVATSQPASPYSTEPEDLAVPNDADERQFTSTIPVASTIAAASTVPATGSFPDRIRDVDAYRQEFQHAIACIGPSMHLVEAKIRETLVSEDPLVQDMLTYVASLGGKRLRPALTLLCAATYGAITDETVRLAAVVELVHTATLVHDDILDQATLRRHKPTVHVRWNVPSSVLVGDWLFTHAYRLANDGESTLPGRWIASAAQRVCEGEIRQGNSVADWTLTEKEYVRMLEDKTGALCGVSCALGAWSAGASLDVCKELEHFGTQLGTAFQIFDDWLDIWGDTQRSGKTLGTDFSQWKPTLPILRTLELLGADERASWISGMEHGQVEAVDWLRERVLQSDASAYTLRFAHDIIGHAVKRLEALGARFGTSDAIPQQSLIRLAHAAVKRAG